MQHQRPTRCSCAVGQSKQLEYKPNQLHKQVAIKAEVGTAYPIVKTEGGSATKSGVSAVLSAKRGKDRPRMKDTMPARKKTCLAIKKEKNILSFFKTASPS